MQTVSWTLWGQGWGVGLRTQGSRYCFGILRSDLEQGSSRALGTPASLFPVLQGRDTDPYHQGKLRLGFLQFLSDQPDIVRVHLDSSARFEFTALDRTGLFDAVYKFVKVARFHDRYSEKMGVSTKIMDLLYANGV